MTENQNNQAPKQTDENSTGKFISTEEAEKESVSKSYFNQQVDILKTNLANANAVSYFIVVILFVGFLSMFGIVISILIQWWSFNNLTQSDLTKAVQNQNILLKQFSSDQEAVHNILIHLTPSPTK